MGSAELQGITGRLHDLPVTWDGQRVAWREWTETSGVFACPPSPTERCEGCGSAAGQKECLGVVHPVDGQTIETTRPRRLPSGRMYKVPIQVPAWPLAKLYATRCPDCNLDTVHDIHTGEMWTLDESDYGADGSTDTPL